MLVSVRGCSMPQRWRAGPYMERVMSDELPLTAREVRAYLDMMLDHLSPKERRRFWIQLHSRSDNLTHVLMKIIEDIVRNGVFKVADIANDTYRQLKKHHPKRNDERDAEIIRLSKEGKTSGKIAQIITPLFGKTTSSTVRSVLKRCRSEAKEK
jgi:hypothetical protein